MNNNNYQNIENPNNYQNRENRYNLIKTLGTMRIIILIFDIILLLLCCIFLGISVSSKNKLNDVLISTNCTTLNDYQVIINTNLIDFPEKELIVYSPFKNSKIGEYSCEWNPCYLDLDHFYNDKKISCRGVIKNRPIYYNKLKIFDFNNTFLIVMIVMVVIIVLIDFYKFKKLF